MKTFANLKIFTGTFIGLILMLPIWPVEGLWFGLPAWAVLCVLGCAATSCWIAWAALFRWRELEGTDPVD
ncbi:MAG: hypothetical protein G3M70_09035 [Candidatus Nitronauta litoralis]|uniref:Uncharacterized protein n=1 Tax=Candidatus Nitronauta litoralis TaxID=2705533 RepID=A0A7T0BT08_9BACT|nr:MAG: hypothetical protein G3M70_09035 [Candidatus Nitronauta litoralis]